MKKTIALLLIITCILSLTSGLTGCTSAAEDDAASRKTAVCFVLGGHANSRGLNLNSPLVQDTVYGSVRNYGFIGVVSVDGKPEVVHAESYEIEDRYKSASDERLDMDARAKTTNVLMCMQNVIADDPEAAYLEALHLAVRLLSPLEGYASKTIIVLGTGLSNTGVLDFGNNLLCAEPEAIVALLNERAEIPDFSGITVYWQQLGDVAAPQEELTSAQRLRLQDIYSGIVEAGSGTFFYNAAISNPANTSAVYPTVTPVELPKDTPIFFDPGAFADPDDGEDVLEAPVFLTEEQVTFISDSANYLHPEEALETLRPIAEYLIEHPITILLAGTTAGDTDSENTKALSLARADSVKATLVALGVDESRILAVGLGSAKDPWHIWGAGYKGAAASANRKVVVLDATSETARSILAQP